ncbi:MAG: sugar phosphate isomerase/epimerase family protein [Anaerolineae bacterium]|nr:sugar phosphate isomerase/epimerase [Anaerolineae bacterium]MDW8100495.1 sugar phosphate isomerase/epimerase family protein [Anaerolineae bacterium]
MKLSLAIQTPEVQPIVPVALLSGTFEEKLAKAARLGVDGVELMTCDPAQLDAGAIRAALNQYGLAAAAVGSGAIAFATGLTLLHADPVKAQQAEARLHELISFAAAIGAPLVTIGSFRGRAATVGDGARGRLIALLRSAADEAAARGVRLVLEPLNRYEMDLIRNADEGLAFLDEVAHPALGLLLDTYHANIEESSWTEPFRRAMAAGRLWHIHLGDNHRRPPGSGLIPFPLIVATLRELGYQGFLSAELLAQPDPDTAAEQTVSYMRTLI